MMERSVETAEGRTGLQLSHLPQYISRETPLSLNACGVCVCVCKWAYPEKMSLKLMTAMKWDVGGIDFFFFLPLLTRLSLFAKDS